MFKTAMSFSGQASAGGGVSAAPVTSPSGTSSGPGGWHPTILYMLGLVVAEIVTVALLSRHLLR